MSSELKQTIHHASEGNIKKFSEDNLELPQKGPGDFLKQVRIKQGLTLEEVASQLHLTTQVLQNLENDHYKSFSALVFLKGYLRAYAKFLQVSVHEVMHLFEKLGIEEKEYKYSSEIIFEKHREFTDKMVPWFLAAVIILLITLILVWWHVEHRAVKNIATSALQHIQSKSILIAQTDSRHVFVKGEPNPMAAVHDTSINKENSKAITIETLPITTNNQENSVVVTSSKDETINTGTLFQKNKSNLVKQDKNQNVQSSVVNQSDQNKAKNININSKTVEGPSSSKPETSVSIQSKQGTTITTSEQHTLSSTQLSSTTTQTKDSLATSRLSSVPHHHQHQRNNKNSEEDDDDSAF